MAFYHLLNLALIKKFLKKFPILNLNSIFALHFIAQLIDFKHIVS